MNAMNAHRNMSMNSVNSGKSMEKLSSGLRINKAGDDAAGLAISEKMRGQIRGLDQASRNAQDGISMIQTAEGALNETHSILQRMRELAVQSSNDSNVGIDRDAIQGEIEQLKSEIDRIGNTTEFNTQSLLKGDGKQSVAKTGITALSGAIGDSVSGNTVYTDVTQSLNVTDTTGGDLDSASLTVKLNGQTITVKFERDTTLTAGTDAFKVDTANATGNTITIKQNVATGATAAEATLADALGEALTAVIEKNSTLNGNYKIAATATDVSMTAVSKDNGGKFFGDNGFISASSTSAILTGASAEDIGVTAHTDATLAMAISALSTTDIAGLAGTGFTVGEHQFEFYNANDGAYKGDVIGINISEVTDAATLVSALDDQLDGYKEFTATSSGTTLTLTSTVKGKAGDKLVGVQDGGVQKDFKAEFQIGANQNQTMEISIGDMRSKALGVENVDLSSKTGAQSAVTVIQSAIEKVSTQRSELGAYQNRLEHTIANLGTSSENLTSAESRIRDVDMAKEMMQFSKNNILSQAAQAMLAQANQQPQGVLQLLR
jgi:flagellin